MDGLQVLATSILSMMKKTRNKEQEEDNAHCDVSNGACAQLALRESVHMLTTWSILPSFVQEAVDGRDGRLFRPSTHRLWVSNDHRIDLR